MSESLLRLVYVSTATTVVDADVLQSILESSSARNESSGVTGVLCSGGEHYMQVLEGPERIVLPLYARIAADPRHRDSTLLSISLVAKRMFGAWSMGHIEGQSSWSEAHTVLMAERQDENSHHRIAVILQRFVAALTAGQPRAGAASSAQKKQESAVDRNDSRTSRRPEEQT
jgi:hypothetical protein